MCIDYGTKRIGIAASDPTATISYPLTVIINKGLVNNVNTLAQLSKENQIQKLVFGLPIHYNGTEGEACNRVRELGMALSKATLLEVDYHDERYSSMDAEEHIKQNLGIKNPKKVVELVDKVAASMILNSYLKKEQTNGK